MQLAVTSAETDKRHMLGTSKIRVIFGGKNIGLIFISLKPGNLEEKVATIIPIDRLGKWTHDDLTVIFEKPVHDFFPTGASDEEIQKQITSLAGIEPWKVTFRPDIIIDE